MQIKNKILLLLKPLQMWIQRRGYIENQFTVDTIRRLLVLIKPGDILLSYESGRWTSLFIKGEWDHAAIVDTNLYVIEAVGDNFLYGKNLGGVRKVKLEEWLWKKNHIAVLRHIIPNIARQAAEEATKHLGKNYDYAFSQNRETLYCSELVYISYYPFTSTFLDFVPPNKEVLPIDYLNEQNLKVIYNSREWINP